MTACRFSVTSILVVCLFVCSAIPAFSQKLPTLGIAVSLEHDSLVYVAGFRLIGAEVSNLIGPNLSEEQFEERLQKIKATKCRVFMANVLFPGSVKIAGPDVSETKVLTHLNAVLARAKKAGIRHLVLGSGGARRVPEDYDKQRAKEEFAALGKKMAAAAKQFDVVIILEGLNSTETNFLTTLREAADIVRKVNHPNYRLNADIYHMMKENESPQEIINAGKLIVYCEIAEKEKRTLPGVTGEDFRPYLKALKKIKFSGTIMIEGRITDLKKEAPQAFTYLTKQLTEVYHGKSEHTKTLK